MFLLQQNETVAERRDLFVQMVDASDYVTARAGCVLSVQLVKAGAAQYVASGATVTEVGSGTYRIRLAAADLDVLGAAMLRVRADGAADQYIPVQVVRFPEEIHLAKAALVNARSHVVHTGVDQIKDDDGVTVLRTLVPSEVEGTVMVAVE